MCAVVRSQGVELASLLRGGAGAVLVLALGPVFFTLNINEGKQPPHLPFVAEIHTDM